jgi:hypothetical protein
MKVEENHLGIQKCDSCGYQFRWKESKRQVNELQYVPKSFTERKVKKNKDFIYM